MSNRHGGLAHFLAGFGTGYLNADEKKKERERQDKLDQVVLDRADRERQDYQDRQALEEKLRATTQPTYSDKAQLDAEGLRGTMPGVFQDTETAQNFLDNPNATADQKASVLRNYAKVPEAGANMNGQQFIAGDGGSIGVADPSSARQKPAWQVMQDRSRVYLESGKSEHADAAMRMLEQSQKLRSQNYLERIMEARKGGVDGLLKLMHDHPNEELDIQNPRIVQGSNGMTAQLVGDSASGQPIQPVNFDLRNGSIEDQITKRLAAMASPEAMLSHISSQIDLAKQARKEDFDERKLESGERIAEMREDRRDERQQSSTQAMEERQGRWIAAAEARQARRDAKATGRVTPAQEANNQEIRLARKRLAGMTTADLRGKTQQYLANGRENPEFDPMLANVWRTANQRMVGEDRQFDDFTERAQPMKRKQTPSERFHSDPSMRGLTMGKMTGRGWEVRDGSGNLVGHWQ